MTQPTVNSALRQVLIIEWHYTPEHASWLNIAECELFVLRQSLRSRVPDIETVRQKLTAREDPSAIIDEPGSIGHSRPTMQASSSSDFIQL